jgi:hypothetical protein
MKEKAMYVGIGFLLGLGVSLFSVNIKINNVGHLDKLTIVNYAENKNEEENKQESEANCSMN